MPEMKDNVATQPVRRRLPDERKAIVHHFNVGGYEGYLTVGFYEDGTPGEIFITTAKEGSTVSGLMDCFATAVSLAPHWTWRRRCRSSISWVACRTGWASPTCSSPMISIWFTHSAIEWQ